MMSTEAIDLRTTTSRACESITVELPDGRRLGARRWRGTGEPLVLLHGLLDSCEGWNAVVSATSRPCLAIDLPGFGRSSPPSRPRISAFAEDVVAALDELAIGSLTLVGHSLGGAVATGVVERVPDRVSALFLLAPAGFGRIPLAEALSIPGVRSVADAVMPVGLRSRRGVRLAYMAMVSNGAPPEPGVLERVVDHAGELAPGASAAIRAIVAAGLSERAFHRRRIAYDGPVVAVWGDRDRLVPPAHARGVRHAFPQAHCEVWPAMGHHPQRERPAELMALLRQTTKRAGKKPEAA